MEQQIKLNKYEYVDAEAKNMSNLVNLTNDKKVIRENEFNEIINEYNVYLDEREKCDTIRLTAQINLMASNSLFNVVTEIVKNEDSNQCECLNFTPKKINTAYAKKTLEWGDNISDCIQDTQITYSGDALKNYTYHCGIDIFDNHVLRSKISTPNYYYSFDSDSSFNTISDYLMDGSGAEWTSAANNLRWTSVIDDKKNKFTVTKGLRHVSYIHLYNKNNLITFEEALNSKLIDKNGWLGFLNKSKLDSYDVYGKNFGISRVINNKPVNAFIDLYPGKDCYSIMPYYNKARHRNEKNWEYTLTYPCSSTKISIPCINEKLGSLKIAFIDESELDDDELLKTVVYSSCKHGLKVDDIVNIYKSSYDNTRHELYAEKVLVDTVIDDYTFMVYLDDYVCANWVNVFDSNLINSYFKSKSNGKYYTKTGTQGPEYVVSFNNYINADFDSSDKIGSQNLSFVKIEGNQEVEYYVRIFSRFPNFDFMDGEVNEETIYGQFNGSKLNIDEYSRLEYEKQSTLTRLGFAKNAYGDDMAQIVFNDDIKINGIKDNLGRPLTSLYLTFFKTNYGREKWYNGDVTDPSVEHSHCFGKLNCGLELSPNINNNEFNVGNARLMNNIDDGFSGLSQLQLRGHLSWLDDDEVSNLYQDKFYGDLCEYSKKNCIERVLQPVVHRFNTQQRELAGTNFVMKNKFHAVIYHNIVYDNVTTLHNFQVSENVFDAAPTSKRDGYTYISSYEIPIRTFSGQLSEFIPKSYKLSSLKCDSERNYTATTSVENYMNYDSDINLYDMSTGTSYRCNVINILSTNVLSFTVVDKKGIAVVLNTDNLSNYRLYKKPVGIPSYANVSEDGSGIYRWRNLVENGFENSSDIIDEYPFTNGRLYVNKLINIFVRRQDPFGIYGLGEMRGIGTLDGKPSPVEFNNGSESSNIDDTVSENSATC